MFLKKSGAEGVYKKTKRAVRTDSQRNEAIYAQSDHNHIQQQQQHEEKNVSRRMLSNITQKREMVILSIHTRRESMFSSTFRSNTK
ncbi:hypothetical protein AKJ16_DCAP11726, partial [Drosera capensis]